MNNVIDIQTTVTTSPNLGSVLVKSSQKIPHPNVSPDQARQIIAMIDKEIEKKKKIQKVMMKLALLEL